MSALLRSAPLLPPAPVLHVSAPLISSFTSAALFCQRPYRQRGRSLYRRRSVSKRCSACSNDAGSNTKQVPVNGCVDAVLVRPRRAQAATDYMYRTRCDSEECHRLPHSSLARMTEHTAGKTDSLERCRTHSGPGRHDALALSQARLRHWIRLVARMRARGGEACRARGS